MRKKRKMARKLTAAVAYLRTSSAANVGSDKDSDKRQRDAIILGIAGQRNPR